MQTDLALLPKRNFSNPVNFQHAQECSFFTNYYQISLDEKKSVIYQYALTVDIPQDSTQLLYKIVRSLKKQLKDSIQLLSFRGNMLWGKKSTNIPLSFISTFLWKQQTCKFQVTIKQTKQLNFFDLLKGSPQDAAKVIQVLNINTKEKLRNMKMNELGQGKFYLSSQFNKDQIKEAGLSVWRGYKFSLCMVNQQPLLQIDVCSRVLRISNFAETIQGQSREEIINKYKGAIVIARYGNHRTYKIQQIDFTKSPLSQFHSKSQNAVITFEKYYSDVYMLKVQNRKQPLIYSISKIERQIKNGKIEEITHYCYLLPQFVSLTGMSDEQRRDNQTMRSVADFTKLTVDERVKETETIKQKLNQEKGMYEIKGSKRVNGFVIEQPQIRLVNNETRKAREGNILLKDTVRQPASFNDWMFVYSAGSKSQQNDYDADFAIETMKKAQGIFGITSKPPGFIVINGRNLEDWKTQIRQDIKQNGVPQIIALLLAPYQQKYYGQLKRFITNQIKVPCQFIRKRTLSSKSKTSLSCASKIVLQMNAKLGKCLWEVKTRHVYFKDKRIMYGALSISKGKGGFTLAFVGTTNLTLTSVYSDCKLGIKRKEEIPAIVLQQMFIQWAKHFYMTNKTSPEIIIMYREGLSDSQIKKQLSIEIQSLGKMVSKISKKTNQPNYSPEIVYVTVNKKINSRFYSQIDRSQYQAKFAPKLNNPGSGSVILQDMSINNAYDFHLVPQLVTQGTCTPTLYRIVNDSSNIPQQALIQLTFQQCFNYYNWQGAVRVPACLQLADKLSKLVGQYIKQDIVQSSLQSKQYFL